MFTVEPYSARTTERAGDGATPEGGAGIPACAKKRRGTLQTRTRVLGWMTLAAVMLLAAGSARAMDADAAAYIAAVEAADGESLEYGVKKAINDFVVGCKSDEIWDAIKASCILAGARTLDGALVPLVGTAPTNVGGLFVSGDYDRKTGLWPGAGNTTKYLNSNRNYNDDPQNDFHLSVYISTAASSGTKMYIGGQGSSGSPNDIYRTAADLNLRSRGPGAIVGDGNQTGFAGHSRASAVNFSYKISGATLASVNTTSIASTTPRSILVFARNNEGVVQLHADCRLAFYSIGESLDLAKLDARVTTLIATIADPPPPPGGTVYMMR